MLPIRSVGVSLVPLRDGNKAVDDRWEPSKAAALAVGLSLALWSILYLALRGLLWVIIELAS